MQIIRKKKKNKSQISYGENRLLRESLKQLLGTGLVDQNGRRILPPDHAYFLKDALNSRILNN